MWLLLAAILDSLLLVSEKVPFQFTRKTVVNQKEVFRDVTSGSWLKLSINFACREAVLQSRLLKGQSRTGRGSVLWKGLRRRFSKGQTGAGRGRVLGRVCEEGCWRVRCYLPRPRSLSLPLSFLRLSTAVPLHVLPCRRSSSALVDAWMLLAAILDSLLLVGTARCWTTS